MTFIAFLLRDIAFTSLSLFVATNGELSVNLIYPNCVYEFIQKDFSLSLSLESILLYHRREIIQD